MPEKLESWRIKNADADALLRVGRWVQTWVALVRLRGCTVRPVVLATEPWLATATPGGERCRGQTKGLDLVVINVGFEFGGVLEAEIAMVRTDRWTMWQVLVLCYPVHSI